MIRAYLVPLALFALSSQAFAQRELKEKHPIDLTLEECHSIDSNQTTYGMMECEATAQEEWDSEMNKYYKLLMEVLKPEEKEKLKAAQRQWIVYRDNEKDFATTMYYNMEGTMWRVVAAGRLTEIIRARALELKGYYEVLTIDK